MSGFSATSGALVWVWATERPAVDPPAMDSWMRTWVQVDMRTGA
jgi:hypothetical protein